MSNTSSPQRSTSASPLLHHQCTTVPGTNHLQRTQSATTPRHPSPLQQCLTPGTQPSRPRNLSLSQLNCSSTHAVTTATDHGTRPRSRTAGDDARFVPLACGWYEGIDALGRKFYLHRQRRVTQWDVPDEVLPFLPPLPPGWTERTDAHGHTYYVNMVQKVSQRARPGPHDNELHALLQHHQTKKEEKKELPPVQTDDLEPGWQVVLNGTVRRAYFYHPARGVTQWSVPTKNKTLPEGWDMRLDFDTHRRFYVHLATKKTQWKPPKGSSM